MGSLWALLGTIAKFGAPKWGFKKMMKKVSQKVTQGKMRFGGVGPLKEEKSKPETNSRPPETTSRTTRGPEAQKVETDWKSLVTRSENKKHTPIRDALRPKGTVADMDV